MGLGFFLFTIFVLWAIYGGNIAHMRRDRYKQGKILGDVNAIMRGKIVRRVAQRKLGQASRRAINRILRG